jgi:hypothetical protein
MNDSRGEGTGPEPATAHPGTPPAFYLAAAIAGSAISTAYGTYEAMHGTEPHDPPLVMWKVVFCILLTAWISADSRPRPMIHRPFCRGATVFFALPVYAPYYLIRTRGAAGVLWIMLWLAILLAGIIGPGLVG